MFSFDVESFLSFYWTSISIGVFLPGLCFMFNIELIKFIEKLYLVGKLRKESSRFVFDISKRRFRDFYVFGLLTNVAICLFFQQFSLMLGLFFCHMLRRLFECFFVHQWNENSTMSFIHYLIGLAHYPMVGLTMNVDQSTNETNLFSLILFVIASSAQNLVHRVLAESRRQTKTIYSIPRGCFLFEFVSCPNYLAEILIYVAFFLQSQKTLPMTCLTIWVLVNQSISALLAHRWYIEKFGTDYPSKRRALLPFLM